MPPAVRWLIVGLTAAACGLSILLFADHFRGTGLPGCGSEAPCGSVMATRWAWWWIFPVAGFGTLLYAGMCGLALMAGRAAATRRVRSLLLALAIVAVAAGVWFTSLQAFIIGHFCPYCLAVHACGLLSAVLIFTEFARPSAGRVPFAGPVIGGALVALLFIGGQAFIQPRMYRITEASDLASSTGEKTITLSSTTPLPATVPATREGIVSPAPSPLASPAPVPRRVTLLSNRMTMNVEGHPILGSPGAPQIMVELFDYTCPECRFMHGVLAQSIERYAGQLAILVLPVPLNKNCNPSIKVFKPEHAESCAYARLCLAVWQGAPERFAEFDRWMWEGPTAPPIPQVRQRAEQAVGGKESLEKLLAAPVIDAEIAQNVKLFQFVGEGTLPKLLLSNALINGRLDPPTQLFEVLEKRLKLTPIQLK